MTIHDLAVPSRQQLLWQDMELGMFCHFGMNTFHNQEWGRGDDPPSSFNPSALDVRQWVRIASQAGFRYFILTAKHHDGFCLWPTRTTDYSVRSSPWRDGRGDLVDECAEACRAAGLGFGVYLSPWDRHEPRYHDQAAYDDFYAEQLTELLTGYGPLVEVWFDGAGSEGRVYDWPRFISLVKRYQPDAMIFNMGEPTIRWVGNEDGVAPYPCWNTRQYQDANETASWLPGTPEWLPAECDVPIRRKHWFWHPNDEASLRSLDELMDIYYRSVGHGANLLLNVAPDARGLIPDVDTARVQEFGAEIRKRFAQPVAEIAGQGYELELALPAATLIDHAILMEDITGGERVREYRLEAEQPSGWIALAHGSAIGHKKIDRFDAIETQRLRLCVISAVAPPLIRRFAAFSTDHSH